MIRVERAKYWTEAMKETEGESNFGRSMSGIEKAKEVLKRNPQGLSSTKIAELAAQARAR